ncbi:hypothetical protein FQR65_LT19240 [Abscondita terminalis]|nr:hypothetical protein FQR65_LT19240 [Abscondita terminalis]
MCVFTLIRTKITFREAATHECLIGANLQYRLCQDEILIEKKSCSSIEPQIENNLKLSRLEVVPNYQIIDDDQNTDSPTENNDPNKLLIAAVEKRPPLFDFKISLQQRSKLVVRKLWEEVHSEIGGVIALQELSGKFKNLRDRYISLRVQYNKKPPSGSSLTFPDALKYIIKDVESSKEVNIAPKSVIRLTLQFLFNEGLRVMSGRLQKPDTPPGTLENVFV